MARARRLSRSAAIAVFFGGCTAIPLAPPDAPLGEDQIVDMIRNPHRWVGRTVTLRIYPFDNGFRGSYVACLEPCDANGAGRSAILVYTEPNRFTDYRGDRAEVVQAVFRRICPADMPLCLDAPVRIFRLDEVR